MISKYLESETDYTGAKPRRARIYRDGAPNWVVLEFDDPIWDCREFRRYHCPRDGGYIRDDSDRQVCAGLAYRGNTLRAASGDALLSVIRREWPALRRELVLPWLR